MKRWFRIQSGVGRKTCGIQLLPKCSKLEGLRSLAVEGDRCLHLFRKAVWFPKTEELKSGGYSYSRSVNYERAVDEHK